MPRKSAAALSVVAGTIDGRPAPPEDLTEFQREVWQRTVASEASKFFNTAALQVARQRAISLSATSDMLRARPGAPTAHRGHLKVSVDPTGTALAVGIYR
jgi:hypothetical protein